MSARRQAACGALLAIGLAVAGSFGARAAADPSSESSASPSASGPKQILVPLGGKSFKNMAAPVLGADELNAPVLVYYAPIGSADGAETTVEGEGETTTTLSSDVNFEVDSANLTPRAREVLDGLVSTTTTTKSCPRIAPRRCAATLRRKSPASPSRLRERGRTSPPPPKPTRTALRARPAKRRIAA